MNWHLLGLTNPNDISNMTDESEASKMPLLFTSPSLFGQSGSTSGEQEAKKAHKIISDIFIVVT
jgi:hypothetical protein|tara:strand:+ start:151 stop:342 length:192 start_codon:yes stop_codon:yes gene_type:complete